MVTILFSNFANAAIYTLNNGSWSGTAPNLSNLTSNDTIIISSSSSSILQINQSITVGEIRLESNLTGDSRLNHTSGTITGKVTSSGNNSRILGAGTTITGSVTITAGTLIVNAAKTAGSWILSGGTLTNNAALTGAITVSGTATLNGNNSTVGAVTVTGGTLTVSSAKTATSWTLSGGTLTNNVALTSSISSSGTSTLNGSNAAVGAVTVTGGTLTVSTAKTASSWAMSGGNLTNSANITGTITASQTGELAGSGTVAAVTVTGGVLTIAGNMTYSRLTLNGGSANIGSSDPTGPVTISQSATITAASGGTIDALTISSGTLTIAGSNMGITTLTMSGGTLSLGSFVLASENISITGNSTITGSGTGYIDANTRTLTINGGNLTLDNSDLIIDNLTFSSAHDISATNGGILSFNNSSGHTINNAAADRHVIGKIRVYLNDSSTNSNTYPLGDGLAYAPIFLQANGRDSSGTNLSNPSGGFGTHYIDMVYTGSKNSNTNVDNTLPGSASGEEFWTVTRSASKPAAALTFRFSTTNTGTTFSKTRINGTLDTAKLRTDIKVASFNLSTQKWTAITTAYSIVSAQNYIAVTTSSIVPNTSFTIGSNNVRTAFITPLPVSLIDFSAKANDKNIEVKWSTASEKDNASFVVEKSIDGLVWSSVATVKGAKNSNVVNNYVVVDYKAVAGFQYYRLKQIDLDGTVNYSKAIAVNFAKASTLNVNLFPNPAKDAFNITTENNATGEVNIQILNSMGETVYNQVVEAGLVQTIDIASFISGVYYVTVIAEGESKIIRLLKN